jgi:hypothetical protein
MNLNIYALLSSLCLCNLKLQPVLLYRSPLIFVLVFQTWLKSQGCQGHVFSNLHLAIFNTFCYESFYFLVKLLVVLFTYIHERISNTGNWMWIQKSTFVHVTNEYISNTKYTFKICMLIWALHYLEDIYQIKPHLKYTNYEYWTKLCIFHDIMLKINKRKLSNDILSYIKSTHDLHHIKINNPCSRHTIKFCNLES